MVELAALEAALAKSPDDLGAVLVYADALQALGDPQGEFLALHCALEGETDPSTFLARKRRLEALLAAHAATWLQGSTPSNPVWRRGFVVEASFPASESANLGRFLGAPATRLLRQLHLFAEDEGFADAVELLLAHAPLTLQGLTLDAQQPGPPCDVGALLARVPLRRLTLRHAWARLPLHAFEALRLDAPVADPSLPVFLEAADWRQLTSLGLLDLPLPFEAVRATLTPARLPRLKHLELGEDLADELAACLATSPLVKTLETASLRGPFTDAGLDALLRESARLSRLKRLTLVGGAFSAPLRRMARKQLPQLDFVALRRGR
jgi:uncharacterized protein (TIGR02996 family)